VEKKKKKASKKKRKRRRAASAFRVLEIASDPPHVSLEMDSFD
jgi:hypothetical protein